MVRVENNQESQGFDAGAQPEASGDKRSMFLKLAERTVVEAEALAQEIIDHARQESEAAGDKILADASEKAKADTQQTIGNAERRSEAITREAAAEREKTLSNARSESRRLLSKAQSDIEKLMSEAKDEVEKIVSEARFAHEADLGAAPNEVQEIRGTLMAEKNQESQGLGGRLQPEATGDKRSMLLESLAQEITDYAKEESESAGAKIIAEASEKAEAEAQKTTESAKRRSETLASKAASKALAESEKTLGNVNEATRLVGAYGAYIRLYFRLQPWFPLRRPNGYYRI